MTDEDRTPQVARMTPPDALALPHVIEAIATCSMNQEDFESFLRAVPRSLWTPALAAFLRCNTVMPSSVITDWPRIRLTDVNLPTSVFSQMEATLPLRPSIDLRCPVRDAALLAALVAVVGPSVSSVTLHLSSNDLADGQGRAISNLVLQCCPRLRYVIICVESNPTGMIELNELLAVVVHPRVEDLIINLHGATTPRLGHHLASWLSTAPSQCLHLSNVAQMDHDGTIAFCDALQANTLLSKFSILKVPSLGGFHGRTLPVSLKTLVWNVRFNGVVDDTTLTDLATAVGPTRLERLECSAFGQLATYPAAAPMLLQLQSLKAARLNADQMQALIAGLSSVPALTSLMLCVCRLSSSTERLMETLATTCVHLETLFVSDRHPTHDGSTAVLSGVLRFPQLTLLTLSMGPSDVLCALPELVAAGRHLCNLHLRTIGHDNDHLDKRAIYQALALVPDVPFMAEKVPADMDGLVIDALSRRADGRHKCKLNL